MLRSTEGAVARASLGEIGHRLGRKVLGEVATVIIASTTIEMQSKEARRSASSVGPTLLGANGGLFSITLIATLIKLMLRNRWPQDSLKLMSNETSDRAATAPYDTPREF